jgi:hypothetical protein
MESTQFQRKELETVKVKFKVEDKFRNKAVTYRGLSFAKFAEKLSSIFGLEPEKHFRLFYFDS